MKTLSKEHRVKVIRTLKNGNGSDNANWKGGRSIQEGYAILRMPNHPMSRSNGYYPEHRFVMEQKLGRFLKREEVIHHINEDKLDNRVSNLKLTNHSEHKKIH